ncbi:hypothetical protein [Flagellimonas aquimarina]|nr:hypothetical protein [Allomuricauda koreensis]
MDNKLQLNNGNPRRLNLTDADKQALEDFLCTLRDETFIADEKFSDPFIN